MNVKTEIKEHPILMLTMAVLSTAIISLGTTSFATISYVNEKHKEGVGYVKEKHNDLKSDVIEIKKTINEINKNILKLYQRK